MRVMPTVAAGRHGIPAAEIPVAESSLYERAVVSMLGRPIADVERDRYERMACRNWTARVVAEDLLGRQISETELAAAKARDPEAWKN